MATKKSAAELKAEGIEISKLLAGARKRDHNFALLISKDGIVLCADPKKPAATMRRQAKAEGGGAKGAQGVMRVNGKAIEFHCENDSPPKMLRKLTMKHLTERGQQFKVIIHTPAGALEDDDDDAHVEEATERAGLATEPEPAAQKPQADDAPETESKPNGDAAKSASGPSDEAMRKLTDQLLTEFSALEAAIETASAHPVKGVAKKTRQMAQMFKTEIEKDPKKADKVLTLLKQALAAAVPLEQDNSEQPAKQSSEPGVDAETLQTSETPLATVPLMSVDPADCPSSEDDAITQLSTMFGAFWDRVCEPSEGDLAQQAERDKIAQQRERMGQAGRDILSGNGDLAAFAVAYTRLNTMVTTAQQIEDLEAVNPVAATEARQAMAAFDEELGEGTPITPELLAALQAEKTAAETRMREAQTQLEVVARMPEGPDKVTAMATIQAELDIAGPQLEAAQNKLRAAKGKKQLAEAITVGPLAPDAPRPLEDGNVARLIEAFTRDPDLATFAAETAGNSQNPDAIANGIGTLCDNVEAGFVDAQGNAPPDDFKAGKYAQHLLTGAGNEGGNYLQEASGYIASGGHLQPDPIPSPSGTDTNGRSRDRTHFIASNVLGPGGTIDVGSDDAKDALGHLRFSPDVIDNPVPEVNSRVQDMYQMLSDPDNDKKAEDILTDIDTPSGAGATLVGRSAGSGISLLNPDADDARRSVMMSLMTPVHQGDVGSCFSTAGVRRMSEQDPLEAMKRYAEIAETGEFQPRNGMDAIPAVTSFPFDEDPLIRSLEYSTATAMAGMEGNSRHDAMQNALNESVDGLATAVSGLNGFERFFLKDDWDFDQQVIRTTLQRSFIIEYDATAQSEEQAADGNSDHGGYFLVQVIPTRRVINTKAMFIEALTERVLTCLAINPNSDQGKEVAKVIKSEDYLEELENGDMAPWNLGGGGGAIEADEVLFGDEREHQNIISTPGFFAGIFGDTQGDRTEDVLENMLEQFADADGEMIAIRTVGIHSFNGLPNHPSLAPLQQGDDFEGNIEEHLLEPGREIAATPLAEERGARVFQEFMASVRQFDNRAVHKALIDRAEATGLGSGEKTPAQIASTIMTLFDPYLDALAAEEANYWQRAQIADGKTCTNSDRDGEEAKIRQRRGDLFRKWASNKLVMATPVPTFTIADTNWGDGEQTKNFVVAPDPITGEPRLWEQILPDGTLTLTGDDWEDAQWMEITVDD